MTAELMEANYISDFPALEINVVTPEFADRQYSDVPTSTVNVGGVTGIRYGFTYEGVPFVGIILPLGQYKMLLGTTKAYEDIFDQVLSSFKFLKS